MVVWVNSCWDTRKHIDNNMWSNSRNKLNFTYNYRNYQNESRQWPPSPIFVFVSIIGGKKKKKRMSFFLYPVLGAQGWEKEKEYRPITAWRHTCNLLHGQEDLQFPRYFFWPGINMTCYLEKYKNIIKTIAIIREH